MEELISGLFAARDSAHILHLKTKSFAAHMALGDLYDSLVDLADGLAEAHQGKYGILNLKRSPTSFSDHDVITFIKELSTWVEKGRSCINPEDTNILNDWDAVISCVYRTKYKLENLA
jgi:hypothetical protein